MKSVPLEIRKGGGGPLTFPRGRGPETIAEKGGNLCIFVGKKRGLTNCVEKKVHADFRGKNSSYGDENERGTSPDKNKQLF